MSQVLVRDNRRAEAFLRTTTSSWQQAGNVPIEGILRLLNFGYPSRQQAQHNLPRFKSRTVRDIHMKAAMPSLSPSVAPQASSNPSPSASG